MLSGLENIPRITEIREIREHFKSDKQSGQILERTQIASFDKKEIEENLDERLYGSKPGPDSRDEMVILPVHQRTDNLPTAARSEPSRQGRVPGVDLQRDVDSRLTETNHQPLGAHSNEEAFMEASQTAGEKVPYKAAAPALSPLIKDTGIKRIVPPRQRVLVTHSTEENTTKRFLPSSDRGTNEPGQNGINDSLPVSTHERNPQGNIQPEKTGARSKDLERQLICPGAIQRQRVLAISGHTHKAVPSLHKHQAHAPESPTQQVQSGISTNTRNAGIARFKPVRSEICLTKRGFLFPGKTKINHRSTVQITSPLVKVNYQMRDRHNLSAMIISREIQTRTNGRSALRNQIIKQRMRSLTGR